MRPNMVFYNHCLEGETICAIMAFPFTPKIIADLSDIQLAAFAKFFNFSIEKKNICHSKLIRQKMYDMWYAAEDGTKMHTVVPCQSKTRKCSNLASSLNSNYMCKICTEDLQNRLPSLPHDAHDQFLRYKYRMLMDFEEQNEFDPRVTIRLKLRRSVKEYDLQKLFNGYEIRWGDLKIYYSHETGRIQFIYLLCSTQDEAKRVYQNRHHIASKLGQQQVIIESLPKNKKKSYDLFGEPENVAVVVIPPSDLEVVSELAKGEDLLIQVSNLVGVLTQLEQGQFTIETDRNQITGEPDYRQLFINFSNRTYVDRIYNAQPFFGCLLCLKLTHVQDAPFLRYASDVCLMTNSVKVKK